MECACYCVADSTSNPYLALHSESFDVDFMSRCSNAASSCHGLWSTHSRRKEGGQCARRQYNFYGESVCAARRPLIGLALLAATLCALVFPGAAQRVDIPLYRNVSY
eukprot:16604_2